MDNFDDRKRKAKRMLGKDEVRRLERVLKDRINRGKETGSLQSVLVTRVNFVTQADAFVSDLASSAIPQTNNPELPLIGQARSQVASSPSIMPLLSSDPPPQPKAVNPMQSSEHSGSHSAQLISSAIKGEYAYGMLGLVLGLASIIGGLILGLNGVAGSTSWTAKVLGLESQINDAAPGVVLFIVGVFLVWITKPRVKMKDLKG